MIIREGLVCEEYEGYIYLIGISNPGHFCGKLRYLPDWRQPVAPDGGSLELGDSVHGNIVRVSSIIDTWADKLTMQSENSDTSEFEIEFNSSWYLLKPDKYKKACKKRIKIIKEFYRRFG